MFLFIVLGISVFFGGLYLNEIYSKLKLKKDIENEKANQTDLFSNINNVKPDCKDRACSEPTVRDVSEKNPSIRGIYTQVTETG